MYYYTLGLKTSVWTYGMKLKKKENISCSDKKYRRDFNHQSCEISKQTSQICVE